MVSALFCLARRKRLFLLGAPSKSSFGFAWQCQAKRGSFQKRADLVELFLVWWSLFGLGDQIWCLALFCTSFLLRVTAFVPCSLRTLFLAQLFCVPLSGLGDQIWRQALMWTSFFAFWGNICAMLFSGPLFCQALLRTSFFAKLFCVPLFGLCDQICCQALWWTFVY